MPIQAVISQRLYQKVADKMAELISEGEFKVGERLPPERDLARQFAVSRPTVREALIALEIAGLVEIRTGSGAYICKKPAKGLGQDEQVRVADAGPSAFDLIVARRAIEPAIAAQAAMSATKRDLGLIASAVQIFEQYRDGTHWEKLEADQQFHMAVAKASRNPVLIGIMDDLWQGMFGSIFAVLSERTQLTNKQDMTIQDHHTILTCIERRDPVGAQAAMTNHLLHVAITLEHHDQENLQ